MKSSTTPIAAGADPTGAVCTSGAAPIGSPALRRRRGIVGTGLGLGALLLAGCSAPGKMLKAIMGPDAPPPPPPPIPTRIVGTLEAAADVNPDLRKRASPLLVRVFELKTDAAFNNADFMALFQRDQAELAADIVLREEFMLQPGEQRKLDRTAGDQTRFLAVFAAYRDIERARWRALVPVKPNTTQKLNVKLDAAAVSITAAP